MKNGNLLLNTNIVIAILSGDSAVRQRIENANRTFISVISLGELFYGANKSKRSRANFSTIESFAEASNVLDCTLQTAVEYGSIKKKLRESGTPIPENDIWIAAVARQHKLMLLTSDRHFSAIKYLRKEFQK